MYANLCSELHPTYPEYLWYPSVLGNASHSGEKLAADLYKYASEGNHSPTDIGEVVKSLVKDGLGIKDTTSEEIISIVKQPLDILHNAYNFADIISRRAQTGWSTHGHSGKNHITHFFAFVILRLIFLKGVDVNIYTSDRKQAQPLLGNHENTEVGKFLADYLDLDVEAITKELQSKSKSFKMMSDSGTELDWMGAPLPDFVPVQPDHYHGDFKRSLDCGHLH